MRPVSQEPHHRLRYRRFDLRLENSCTDAEARALVDRALAEGGNRVGLVIGRPGTRPAAPDAAPEKVFLKAEFRRPDQPIAKRLRRARAFDEGRGYRAFTAAGIPVPELLLFGEQPRWLPRGGAIVVTSRLPGENSAALYQKHPDDDLVLAAARLLARIHRHELTHGDPALRNFLPCDGRMHVLDLPRWGRFSRERGEKDLALLIGAAQKLGMDGDATLATLDAYVRAWPEAVREHHVGFQGHVLQAAAKYCDRLKERDRTREARHARLRARLRAPERRGER